MPMKNNAYSGILVTAVISAFTVSCDNLPASRYEIYDDGDFSDCTHVSVKGLKDMYAGSPVNIEDNIYIKAQVVSSDRSGNLYGTMYIQDSTAGIELKTGIPDQYDEYRLGQWVYVRLKGLTLGNRDGMVCLGNRDLIDSHIFRGETGEPAAPQLLESDDRIRDEVNFGKYVRIEGLTYSGRLSAILYYDPDGNRQDYHDNCVFLDKENGETYGNYGIDTWAISEDALRKMLDDPDFDFNGFPGVDKSRFKRAHPYTVNQYFRTPGGMDLQIRTNGHAVFADVRICQRILDGSPFNVTGILTCYNSGNEPEYQFRLLDLDGIEIPEREKFKEL